MDIVPLVVYYSTKSGNTTRFVERLGFETLCLREHVEPFSVTRPFILITPTYGGGYAQKAVPKPVIHFLNNEANREQLQGVVSTGNRNFGPGFCLAGRIIAEKCKVPNLHDVEVFGTPEDVGLVTTRILSLFATLSGVTSSHVSTP